MKTKETTLKEPVQTEILFVKIKATNLCQILTLFGG